MEIAREHQKELKKILTDVRDSHQYFKNNYDRYNVYRKFAFKSALSADDITMLEEMGFPQLDFSILEAYIDRLLGEFSKQMPDIEVNADDEADVDPFMVQLVSGHLRHLLSDGNNKHTCYSVMKDILSGGFSVLKIFTDYVHSNTFKQSINIERPYNPTLCGFDPLARLEHKGDGAFCFELFPMDLEQFKEENPGIKHLNELSYSKKFGNFNWSYWQSNRKYIVVAEFYRKKKKREKIVYTSDKKVRTAKDYKKMIDEWGDLALPPAIVNERMTTKEEIVCYRAIENQLIEKPYETDFTMLPLIFVDGNSILIQEEGNVNIEQVTRPYIYHAKDAQRLMNFAGNAIANEIENTPQSRFIVKEEALPEQSDYIEALTNLQKPSTLVVKAFKDDNPNIPIPEPIIPVNRVPAPPEFREGFQGSISIVQNILGSYDASLGINNNQLSGIAIVEAASQSNPVAMPYVVGYLHGIQRAAQIYVSLMPKYYVTPRTLPVMMPDGKRGSVKLNQPEGVELDFDENTFNVTLTAGASFQVQKSRTIGVVKELMQMSPVMQQFFAKKGLNFILDNLEAQGIEELKAQVDDFVKELEEQEKVAKEKAIQEMQQNPIVMKNNIAIQKLQLDAQKQQQETQHDLLKFQQENNKLQAQMEMAKGNRLVQALKASAEIAAKKIDLAIKDKDIQHKHRKDILEIHHKINSKQESRKEH